MTRTAIERLVPVRTQNQCSDGGLAVTGFEGDPLAVRRVVGRHLHRERLFHSRLRYCTSTIEKENRDLFVCLLIDIDAAMNPTCWLVPIHLSGCDDDVATLSPPSRYSIKREVPRKITVAR